MEAFQNAPLPPIEAGEPLPKPGMAYQPYNQPRDASLPDAELLATDDSNIDQQAVEQYLMGVWDRGNSADFVSGQEIGKDGKPVGPIPFAQFYRMQ